MKNAVWGRFGAFGSFTFLAGFAFFALASFTAPRQRTVYYTHLTLATKRIV